MDPLQSNLIQQEPQISVAPESVSEELPQISVAEEGVSTPISKSTAANRANKYTLGSPNSPVSNQTALDMLLQGREEELRKQAVSLKNFDNSVQEQRAINSIAGKQGPLTLPQQLMIRDLVKRKQADPNSVIEENYAEEFTKSLVQAAKANPDSELAQAMNVIPAHVEKNLKVTTDLKAWKEQIDTWAEKAQDAYDAQSWGGWGVDMLKGLTSVYGEFKMRGLVQGPGLSSFLKGPLGTNMERQWSDLMFMPPAERLAKGEVIINQLIKDNPSMALLWIAAGKGLSNEDKFLINAFPVLDLTLLGDAALIGKNLSLARAADKALKSSLKNIDEPISAAAVKEAVGDFPGAAVEQFSGEVVATGNVTSIKNDLQSLMRSEHVAIGSDVVGPMGPLRPIRAGLVDQMRETQNLAFGNFSSAIEKMQKVEQLPAMAATKIVAQRLAASIENEFRGLVNTIADTQLVRDVMSGQWFANYTITKVGGKAFSSVKEVQAYASKLGLGEVEAVEIQGPPKPVKVSTTKAEQAKYLSEEDAQRIFSVENAIDWKPSFKREDLAPPPASKTEQKGVGYYLVKTQPVPINSEYARDLMIVTDAQRTPNKWTNAFSAALGSTRTPEDTMSLANIMNRKIATFSSSLLDNVFADLHKDIKELKGWPLFGTARREKWNQWKEVMSWMENIRNPGTGKKGIVESFSTPGELRDLYTQKLGRAPDDQEIKAAFTYRTSLQLKEQLEKYTKLKNQFREGGTYWTLKGSDPAFETAKEIGKVTQASFSGKGLSELPTSGTVLILRGGKVYTEASAATFRDASSGFSKEIVESVKAGTSKVVQLLEPDENPLLGMFDPLAKFKRGDSEYEVGNLRITHVISSDLTDKGLTMDHMKVKPSNNHDYDHYVVQPRIKHNPITDTHEYIGDHTIAGFNIRAAGADVAEHLDNVRVLLKEGKTDLAKEYYDNSTLPMGWQEIKNWFTPDFSAEVPGGRLSLDERIHVVPGGKLSNEVDKFMERKFTDAGLKFEDRTKETYGQLGLRDPYDVFSLRNEGTKDNPLWKVAETKFIDPVSSINRSLVKVINDVNLNDYKVHSIEHWIQEAKDLLKASDSSLSSSPAWHFYNPSWKTGLSGKDALKVNDLMTSQMQIQQFLGIRDSNTTFLHNTAQILADSIYTRFGEKPYMLAMADKLPLLRDPFRFIRSVSFNSLMGLFSPAQLAVQMSNIFLMAGIAGWDKATVGSGAWLLHTWGRMNRNPEIIEALDKYASKMGFRPGEWKEARAMLESTGFEQVAREHGYVDSTTYHDLIGGPGQTFLHWGQVAFREGERSARTAAWYTAYHEFRLANPIKKITDVDVRTILNRADLFTSNMSRASSSSIQKGVWSLTSQFTTYAVRQAELMLGNRLTDLEKKRLFGTYALLYGVPAAFGSFTLGVGQNFINDAAISKGYVPESKDNWKINTIATEGLPAFLGQVFTGNLYNVGQRYAGGSNPVTDVLRGDKPFQDVVLGASGSIINNSIKGLDGLSTAMHAAIKGIGPFAIKPEDFVDPLKPIKAVDSATRFYQAMQTGKWLSSKEMVMGDASPLNAAFMAATGLSYKSSEVAGSVIHQKNIEKKAQAEGLQQFIKEFHRGIREFAANNPEQGHDYWRRAFISLRTNGYPVEDWGKAVAIASENKEMPNRIITEYYTKNVPTDRQSQAWETYQKYMKTQVKQ